MHVLYFDIAIWVSVIYEYHGVAQKCDYACSFYVTKPGWYPVSMHIDAHVYLELSISFCLWILEWGRAVCLSAGALWLVWMNLRPCGMQCTLVVGRRIKNKHSNKPLNIPSNYTQSHTILYSIHTSCSTLGAQRHRYYILQNQRFGCKINLFTDL